MFHSAGTIETEFKALGEKLDTLLAKAEERASSANDTAHDGVADLEAKRQSVREKLDELRESGGEKWEILKGGIEAAWTDLEVAFEKMSS